MHDLTKFNHDLEDALRGTKMNCIDAYKTKAEVTTLDESPSDEKEKVVERTTMFDAQISINDADADQSALVDEMHERGWSAGLWEPTDVETDEAEAHLTQPILKLSFTETRLGAGEPMMIAEAPTVE